MFVYPYHRHAVEAVRIADQHPPALGQHRVVGGVPRDRERFGDPGHRQVLTHDGLQRPPQRTTRQARPRLGRLAGVLPPHMPAAGAPVAAHRHQQRRRLPPERLVRQPPEHGVARRTLAAAAAAPLIRLEDAARQHRPIRLETLPEHDQTDLVEAAERCQIRTGEGSVRHVEVFRLGGVGTPIIGRPRPSPRHRRAHHYTSIRKSRLTLSRDIRARCPVTSQRGEDTGLFEPTGAAGPAVWTRVTRGNRSEATIYEQCGFPTLHRTLARVGSRMRPIQALYSAGGDADSVRELSVTATGRCSANDRSAAAATRAVIRPSSR